MTRQEVLLATRTTLQSIGLSKLKEDVGKYFFDMDSVVEALYVALTSGLNIILHGPGGFGKTQIVKKFLEVSGLNHSTIVGYEDMEVDGLLGVVNIKKLTEEAVYEICFEKSVFRNPGVLVLEEFLDARPSTAAALKDILTEGGMRRGTELVESLISSVIICTNKSPDEMSNTSSTSAFYRERFPIVVHVAWKSFDTNTYLKYLNHIKPIACSIMPQEYMIISELAARTSAKGLIVSPRIIKYASDLMDIHKSLFCLNNLAGIDTSEINDVVLSVQSKSENLRVSDLVSNIKVLIAPMKSAESYSILFLNESLGKLDYILKKIDSITAHNPENFALIAEARRECMEVYEMLNKKITHSISEKEVDIIDKIFKL